MISGNTSSITITNSINNGKIFSIRLEDSNVYSSSKNSGFITSLYNNTPSTLKISNSVNNGGIVSYLVSPYSAGFIASLNSMFATTITNCMNSGSISSFSGTSYSGGFVGYIPESELNLLVEIKNSINSGSVSSRSSHSNYLYSYSGGFVAYSNGVLRITNSINKGSSSAINKYASYYKNSGFVGKTENSFELINSVNTGSSNYDGIFTKALVGDFENTLEITNSFFDYETSNFLASENNAVGNDVNSLYVDLGKTFENFKEKTFFGVDFFTTPASDDNPWFFNTTGGRPYLYWEKMAISNSKLMSDINNNSIDLSLVDVNNSDEINATEIGLKYCYFDENNIIKEEYCTHSKSKNNIVTLEIDTLDYRIQPYAKLSDDSYVYGDMLAYSSDEYKIVQITLNTSAVIKATQEITFTDLITEVDLSQTQAYTIVASSTSLEVVNFTSLSEDVCEVSGAEITFKTIGTCKIKAEVFEDEVFASYEENFEIDVDNSTDIFSDIQLNFNPIVVDIYTLKGELIKSKHCSTLSEYRVLINGLDANEKFLVK